MKNLKLHQHGWTRVQDHGSLLLIENKDMNCYHIPKVLWEALATATYNAETYRKSRNYFQQSREDEKKACSEIQVKLVEQHTAHTKNLLDEIGFLRHELDSVESKTRDLKAVVLCMGVLLTACFIYIII